MAATGTTVALFAAAITALVGSTLACHGFKVKNMQIKECDGYKNTNVMEDVKPELTPRCTLKPSGCYILNKTLESVEIRYEVKKDGVLFTKGEEDGCMFLENNKNNEHTRPFIDATNFPIECPASPGPICRTEESRLDKYSAALPAFVGKYTVRLEMDYADASDCLVATFEVASLSAVF